MYFDKNNNSENANKDELNLFKAFLVINESLNKSNNLSRNSTTDSIEKIAEIAVALKFSSADIGLYDDVNFELLKLAYATSYRFQRLLDFLISRPEYAYLIKDLCEYFAQKDIENLRIQVDFLLVQILLFRNNNSYKFKVDDSSTANFLDSLCADEYEVETDFIQLRNHPLYKLNDTTYAIIDPFFVLDKFTKSTKFLLKESFNKNHGYSANDGKFLSWFNKDFSEEFLMKHLLDSIFHKKYYIKASENRGQECIPDYYLRYHNDIYLFESKDILIKKEVKTSGDIGIILEALENKLLINKTTNKRIGIGQLINHVEAIAEKRFIYDDKINYSKKINIFPILILTDRMLEIPGLNVIMNARFHENLKINAFNLNIHDLVILDLDSLIFLQTYLENKDRNFKELLLHHIKNMNLHCKGYGKSESFISQFQQTNFKKNNAIFSKNITFSF